MNVRAGNRFLGNYTSDEQEYKALMDSGLTYARQWNLRPGIALTAEQVAQLTSDMVWLVTQEVTLPDGSKQSVLVPQVYVRVQPGDIDGSGALLAGRDVQLNLSGDATNSGTIAGRNLVQINAQSIKNLGGTISADTLALQATQDIDNIGGQMKAQSAALLSAGRDLNLTTTTQSSANKAGNNSFTQTGIDRVAGLYVSGPAGVLIASAGRDMNLTAAQLQNASTGATALSAGNNLNLSTVTTSSSVMSECPQHFSCWNSTPVVSNLSLLGLVFDGLAGLVGVALCLLFTQMLAPAQAAALPRADSGA